MAATAELTWATRDFDRRPPEPGSAPAAPELAEEPLGTPLEAIFATPPGDGAGPRRLLQRHAFSSHTNAAVGVVLLRRAQQTHGNRFAQDAMRRVQRAPSRVVQRECSCGGTCQACATGLPVLAVPPGELILRQAAGGPPSTSLEERSPSDSPGQPLDGAIRTSMEARFGRDLGDVLVHDDAAAHESATALSADAYTAGTDIYFAEGRYRPGTSEGQRLLAHELTHTIQQTAGQTPDTSTAMPVGGGVVVGHPQDALEAEADQVATAAVGGAAAPSVVTEDREPAIRRQAAGAGAEPEGVGAWIWSRTGGRVVRGAERVAEASAEWVRSWLEEHVPTLMEFLRGDPVETLRRRIGEALDRTFGAIFTRIQREGLFGALAGLISEGASLLSNALAAAAADPCGALRTIVEAFIGLQRFLSSTMWSLLKEGASFVSGLLSSLWNDLALPAWEAIKSVAGSVWQWVTDRATEFWEWLRPLRELGARVWATVKYVLGVAWDTGTGVFDWLRDQATAAWDRLKATIEPIKGPLMVIGGVLLLLSPLGPILAIGATAYGLYQAARWLYNNWDQLDIVIRAREILHQQVIPWIRSAVDTVRTALREGYEWLVQQARSLRESLDQLAEALGVYTFLRMAQSAIEWVRGQVSRFTDWVASGWRAVVEAVTPVLSKVWEFLRPIAVVLAKLGLAIANPIVWPIYIGAVVWMILPDCIKPPLINYLLDLMIAGIRAIPNWGFFGAEWPEIKERIAGGLESKRNAPEEEKIRFSNKVANMIAGPDLTGFSNLFEAARQAPDHFVGQVEKELVGMDLSEPLPIEQRPAIGEGGIAQQTMAGIEAGLLAPENAALMQKTAFSDGDVHAEPVPTIDMPPEFFDSFQLGPDGSLGFAENPNPTITNETLRAELAGQLSLGGTPGPEAGAGGGGGLERPPADLSVEEQIRWVVAQQAPVGCGPSPEPAQQPQGLRAPTTPAMQILPPLTQGQRALYVWEQMKRGLAQWYECHKTAIIASLIGVLVLLIVLIVFTEGVILELLPPILEVLAAIFIGMATVKMSMFIADYVARAISGDVTGAAKSLARGLAIGAIELLFFLLTGGAGKGGAKAGQRAVEQGAAGVARAGGRGRPFLEAAGDAGRRFAANLRNPVGAFVRSGRVFVRGLEQGFARGVKSLRELGERLLQRFGFRGFSIRLGFFELLIYGHFNADILLLRLSIRSALEAQERAGAAARFLKTEGQLGSSAVAAVPEALAVSKFGEMSTQRLLEFAARNPRLGRVLSGAEATEAVVKQSREIAEAIAIRLGHPASDADDLLRQMGALADDASDALRVPASHAERQLAVWFPDARAIGSSRVVCPACQKFFSALAQHRQAGLVIADPEFVWIFLKNGRYTAFPKSAIVPLLATESAEALEQLLRGARWRPPTFP